MVANILLVLAMSSSLMVSAVCPKNRRDNLLTAWQGKPPKLIVERWMTGNLTTVYISPAIVEAQPGLHSADSLTGLACYQTVVSKDGVSTTDYWYYRNKTRVAANYNIVMEFPTVVSVIEKAYNDMHIQVVFLKQGVFGLYECDCWAVEDESFTPGAMIRVLNYDKNNKLQAAAIQSAKATLDKLHFRDGVVVPTDCPV